jgi:hypothetical protein
MRSRPTCKASCVAALVRTRTSAHTYLCVYKRIIRHIYVYKRITRRRSGAHTSAHTYSDSYTNKRVHVCVGCITHGRLPLILQPKLALLQSHSHEFTCMPSRTRLHACHEFTCMPLTCGRSLSQLNIRKGPTRMGTNGKGRSLSRVCCCVTSSRLRRRRRVCSRCKFRLQSLG